MICWTSADLYAQPQPIPSKVWDGLCLGWTRNIWIEWKICISKVKHTSSKISTSSHVTIVTHLLTLHMRAINIYHTLMAGSYQVHIKMNIFIFHYAVKSIFSIWEHLFSFSWILHRSCEYFTIQGWTREMTCWHFLSAGGVMQAVAFWQSSLYWNIGSILEVLYHYHFLFILFPFIRQ